MLYTVGSHLFLAGFRALGVDLRVRGVEYLPSHGPGIIASNHIGYLDFAFVMLAPPSPRREVRFLARAEFFARPVVGQLLRWLGQIPVDVHGDARTAASAAEHALARGELVGLHPEGTISPSFVPRRAKSGAIRLADATGAPIIPCAVWGSQRLLTKWRPPRPQWGAVVTVTYGPPFQPTARTAMGRTAELMERIDDLLRESQASYPQRPGPAPHDWWVPAHLGGSAPTPEQAEQRLADQVAARRQELAARTADRAERRRSA